jgi:hypothetical protein
MRRNKECDHRIRYGFQIGNGVFRCALGEFWKQRELLKSEFGTGHSARRRMMVVRSFREKTGEPSQLLV